ncbi:ribonuclease 2, partial [Tanacetum coccineum]
MTSHIIATMVLAVLFAGVKVSGDRGLGGLVSTVAEQREFDYFALALQWPPTYCSKSTKCCATSGCCRGDDDLIRSNALKGHLKDLELSLLESNLLNSRARYSYIHCLTTQHSRYAVPFLLMFTKLPFEYEYDDEKLSPYYIFTCFVFAEQILHQYSQSMDYGSDTMIGTWAIMMLGPEFDAKEEKHGTCASPVTGDEYNYFITTINLYNTYNVTEILFEAGYVPSNSEKYPGGGIIAALENAFHATPQIICLNGALEEVRLCLTKDFKEHNAIVLMYVSLPGDGHPQGGRDVPLPMVSKSYLRATMCLRKILRRDVMVITKRSSTQYVGILEALYHVFPLDVVFMAYPGALNILFAAGVWAASYTLVAISQFFR